MKFAYLISAYQDPAQFGRLLKALDSMSTAFVHIDRSIDISAFRDEAALAPIETIFLKKRLNVNWGSFSQVIYQYMLLDEALNYGEDFSRFIFMTGTDYPLWSKNKMMLEFGKGDSEFITGLNITRLNDVSINWRVQLLHFRDFWSGLGGGARPLTWVIRGLSRLRPAPTYLNVSGDVVDIYMASAYMCISRDLAEYVHISLSCENPIYKKLKYTFVPEEFVIPTIIFNSPFSHRCNQIDQNNGLIGVSRTHYFHYSNGIKVLTSEDRDIALASGRAFGRKFQTGLSDTLMDELEKLHASEDD